MGCIAKLENLEFETEAEVDVDEKCPFVLHSEVERAVQEMRDKKKARGNGDVLGDVYSNL